MEQGTRDTGTVGLAPFVPRLVIDWGRDAPEGRVREVEATLVFVDLSGFTNLSERLGRLGKMGAEEVTDAIGSTFAELLRVAYEAGGSLLKFGGDALLLFFSGDGHPVRAAYAAGGMRRTLRKIGRIETPAGTATLRMSTGIESGTCHLFLTGRSHRELVVAGPLQDRTAAMEAEAKAGEIVVGPGTASALPASLLGPDRGPGVRLSRTPRTPSGTGSPEIVEGTTDVSTFVPRTVREHLVAGALTPEHRQVTVGFLTFGGIGDALEEHGPEGAAAHIETLISTVQEAVDAHDVAFLETDVYPGGGKILLTSGAPQAPEDAEDRMLLALRQIFEAGVELPIRAGVHRGHVFAGVIGPPYRRTYTVMGDAVNTAARVMSRAGWGEILATDAVREWTRVRFELDELPPFTVKGKRRPLTAFLVGRSLGRRRRRTAEMPPLTGRTRELDELLAAVRRATEDGAGTVVEITGEPGIGKSRLVDELVRRADGINVHTSASDPYLSTTPYFAMRALLRSFIGCSPDDDADATAGRLREHVRRADPELEPWLPLLAIPLDVDVGSTREVDDLAEGFLTARLAQTVGDLFAAAGPTLFVLEDVQWIDEPSAEILGHLRGRARDHPWVLCSTTREDSGTETDLRIPLGPLDPDASAALVRETADGALLPQDAARLAERGGGHPLFLQELAASGDPDGLPGSVESLVATRIDRLRPPDRALLRVLSVLGPGAQLGFARVFVREAGELVGDLATLERNVTSWGDLVEYLDSDGRRLRFREPLFQQVAYEGLPYRLRRTLHERAGRLIEARTRAPDRVELLSLHFHEARDHERSWKYSLEAAERARKKFAHGAEVTFRHRALEASRQLSLPAEEEVRGLREDLGMALVRAGRYEDALVAYRDARRVTIDPLPLARLLRREGAVHARLGKRLASSRAILRALRLLEPSHDSQEVAEQRILLRLQLAENRRLKGRLREAIRLCREAVGEAESVEDLEGLAQGHQLLNVLLGDLGDPLAEDHGRKALDLWSLLENPWHEANVLNNLGRNAYEGGRWSEALQLYERSRHALERVGNVLGAAATANNIGEILSDQGKVEEAARIFAETVRTFRAVGIPTFVVVALANLGRAATRAGDILDGRAFLEEAVAGADTTGSNDSLPRLYLAENALHLGSTDEALEILDGTVDGVPPLRRPSLHRTRGCALIGQGQMGAGREALEESLRLARSGEASFEVALTLDTLSRLDDADDEVARCRATEARSIFKRLGVVAPPSVPLPEG